MGWWGPGLVASVLRRVPDEAIALETRFLVAALRLREPACLLDAGCGLARHARLLAARNHRVIACERDAYTAQQAREDLATAPQPGVEVCHRAVEELPPGLGVDGAYALMSPLGVGANRHADEEFLRAVRAALPDGARFVLDYSNGLALVGKLEQSGVQQLSDGRRLMTMRSHDPLTSVSRRTRIILTPDGAEETVEHATIRVYHPHEVLELLHATGFSPLRTYGWFDVTEFRWDSPRFIAVCRAV